MWWNSAPLRDTRAVVCRHAKGLHSSPSAARAGRLLLALCLAASFHALPVAAAAPHLSELPPSLGQWYKPQNKRQVWLHTMFSLRRELQAVEAYAQQGEPELAQKWSRRFAEHLRSTAEMVPEWRDAIDWDELARLEQAVTRGALSAVAKHSDRLRRDCRNCHREYRVLAALRYRSPDFSGLTLEGGQGESIEFAAHMERLSRTLNRIKIASDDNRWNAAAEAALGLRAELGRLSATCANCHRDAAARERILGEAGDAVLGRLDNAIAHRQPKETGISLGQAAVDVCARCHATHRTLSEAKRLLFD